jgi:hypothetical protein
MASFLHNPKTGEIRVWDLNSHSETEKHFGGQSPQWREGHYLPTGEAECRVVAEDRITMKECNARFLARFPTFWDFFNWALKESGHIEKCGYLDLGGLTALPKDVVFPEKCGYLDLGGLTALPKDVVFPEKCGYLYLGGLTALPSGLILPKNSYTPKLKA